MMLQTLLAGRNVPLCAVLLAAVTVICGAPAKSQAQEDAAKKAAALLDKYVEATGGKAAYDGIKNRIVKAEVSVPGRDITLKMTLCSAQSGKFHTSVEMPSGAMERGSDGKVVWMILPGLGAKIIEGAEKVTVIRDSTQDRFAKWRALCSKVEYTEEEEVDGVKCAKIKMTYKPIEQGVKESPVEVLINPETNLIVKWIADVAGPQGPMKIAVFLSDYKKVSGVKLAHKMTIKVAGIEQIVKIDSVQCNADIPADKFALPKEVQELLKK